jgi:hypothetical protein
LDHAFVGHWSSLYEKEELGTRERELLSTTHSAVTSRGYLTATELEEIATWKAQARVLGVLEADDTTVRDVTSVAFASSTPEWMRHHILCILSGVRHPMASAILTIWDPQAHTVMDFHAVEALQELKQRGALDLDPAPGSRTDMPGYWTYLKAYRKIAARVGVGLRDLDRALWKWSKAGMP